MKQDEKNRRIAAGMAAAKERGVHVGRPRLLDDFLVQVVRATHHPRKRPKYELAKEWGVSERTISRALRKAREEA